MLKQIKVNDRITVLQSKSGLLNSTLVEYDDAIIVVDTLLLPAEINELNEIVKSYSKPLAYILNTHYHSDHCYGNSVLRQENTVVIAHELAMNTLLSERNMLRKGRKVEVDKLKVKPPNVSFSDEYILDSKWGIRILHTPGHTPDSSVVILEDEGIAIMGDTVLNGTGITVPYFYWGNPYDMLDSLKSLQTHSFKILIPGHGEPLKSDRLIQNITYLETLIGLSEHIYSIDRNIATDEFTTMLPATDCLPGTTKEDFWVYQMHDLNLKRMLMILRNDK